jgi:hypothetical protein
VLAGADVVGQPPECRRRRVGVELERLGCIDPLSPRDTFDDCLIVH